MRTVSLALIAVVILVSGFDAFAAVYDCSGGSLLANEKVQIDTLKRRAALLDQVNRWTMLELAAAPKAPGELIFEAKKPNGSSMTIRFFELEEPPFVQLEDPLDARLVRKADAICEKITD